MIEHGRVRRHRGGVDLGQVEDARAEANLRGAWDEGGEEDERRRDALAPGAEVLADERLGEAQLIRKDYRFLVLREEGPVVAIRGMHGHGEQAELDGHVAKAP